MDKEETAPRLPRLTSLEDHMDPFGRVELAAEQLKAWAVEAGARPDTTEPAAAAASATVFHKPAPRHSAPPQAGLVSRSAAALVFGTFVGVMALGYTEDGARLIRDNVCALSFSDCAPR